MSFAPPPGYPSAAFQQQDPGLIPLRPMLLGDLFGVGLRLARRHIGLLGPIAVLISALSSAVDIAVMSATDTLDTFASGSWLDSLGAGLGGSITAGAPAMPAGLYVSVMTSAAVSMTGTLLLSGLIAACAGADAVSRTPTSGLIRSRLRGPQLVIAAGIALLVAVATLIGSLMLIAPGVLAFAVWALAAPVAVMERSGFSASLARSARLTRGHRWRIIGVTLLILVVTVAIEAVISALVLTMANVTDPVTSLLVSDGVTALVSAITLPWIASVIALLYVDIRIRTENLAPALRAQAQALAARPAQG